MYGEPPAGESPHRLPPPGRPADVRHGPLTPIDPDMGISTIWGGSGNGGTRRDQGVYCPPQEHGRKIHCNLSQHGLVSCGRAEARDKALVEMVVET